MAPSEYPPAGECPGSGPADPAWSPVASAAARRFELAAVALAEATPEGHLLCANRRFRALLAQDGSTLAGSPLADWLQPEDGEPGLAALIDRAWTCPLGARARMRLTRSVPERPLLLNLAPVRDDAGRPSHLGLALSEAESPSDWAQPLCSPCLRDELTGLATTRLLQDRLETALARAARHGRQLALVYLDLDHFTLVNNSLGLAVGDALLKAVAERLEGLLREADTLARLSGDDFLLLLDDLPGAQAVDPVCRKLLQAFATPFWAAERELHASASLGIALYPDDGADADSLLKNANTALQRAKQQGRNNFLFFTEDMNGRVMELLFLENGLHQALARGEFFLHYQPQVDLRSGAIIGAEALLRWQHPELGLVMPAQFIPIAEESQLILDIGAWVLEQACADALHWQDLSGQNLRLAVNLSVRQFRDPRLAERLDLVLRKTGFPPHCLELEVTESILLDDAEQAVATLKRLKALGVLLAMDDFGTGYSSLNYLRLLPIDRLKIDRSFVDELESDPDDACIVRAIIALARSLELAVIAEGIESEGQYRILARNGCEEGQGFWIGRPMKQAQLLHELSLPLRIAPDPEAPERALLLVDDDAHVLAALERSLRRDGYRIHKAHDAGEAHALMAHHDIGVVVCDQRMPGSSGVEFLRGLRRLHPRTIRIVLTGHADFNSVLDTINEAAVYKFLTKPWDEEQLRDNIRQAFRHHELAAADERLHARAGRPAPGNPHP